MEGHVKMLARLGGLVLVVGAALLVWGAYEIGSRHAEVERALVRLEAAQQELGEAAASVVAVRDSLAAASRTLDSLYHRLRRVDRLAGQRLSALDGDLARLHGRLAALDARVADLREDRLPPPNIVANR